MVDVITIGESMVVFNPAQHGPLRHVTDYKKQMAGAESNVSIGLSRLGHNVSWMSRVGDDEFGRFIISTMRSEGIDTSKVEIDKDASTGIMFKESRSSNQTNVYYYRKGSAASKLHDESIEYNWIKSTKILHVTGITPALSESCELAIRKAMKTAKELGTTVTLDPNLRLKLWGIEKARKTILSLIPDCTYFLPGFSEGKTLTGIKEINDMAKYFYDMGPRAIVIKDGERGAYLYDQYGGRWIKGNLVKNVIDPIGAGDAFAAGFISGLLNKDIVIDVNRSELKQVFLNILMNSIDAVTQNAGKREVLINCHSLNGHNIIKLCNNGPVIPQESIKTIFEPFYTTKKLGTGIGLYVCKNIVEKYNGAISCMSNDQLTTFKIILPCHQAAGQLHAQAKNEIRTIKQ